eukprot:15337167-Ditylum_brightwellii.AAC.1
MEVLDVAVVWDVTTPTLQNPSEVSNIFESQGITRAQVKAHVNLIWATTTHRGAAKKTPNYFKTFGMLPMDVVALRNQEKLRQVMFVKMLWNSLDPKYQLKLLTKESLFTNEGNHNGLLLWHHIVERVNLSTKVTVANLKDKIEGATLDDFRHDIKRFNLWFIDKRTMIVKEIRTEGYTKYTCCLFKTYLSLTDVKFLRGIKDKQKEWILVKQNTMHGHADLMDLALKLYNNQKVLGEWNLTIEGTTNQEGSKESKSNGEPKYLALLTKQLQTLTMKLSMTNPSTDHDEIIRNGRGKVVPNW